MGEILIDGLRIHISLLIITGGQLVLMDNLFEKFRTNYTRSVKAASFTHSYEELSKFHSKLENTLIIYATYGTFILLFIPPFISFLCSEVELFSKRGVLGTYFTSVLLYFFVKLGSWLKMLDPHRKTTEHLIDYYGVNDLEGDKD